VCVHVCACNVNSVHGFLKLSEVGNAAYSKARNVSLRMCVCVCVCVKCLCVYVYEI
jgi:hypothetical protein